MNTTLRWTRNESIVIEKAVSRLYFECLKSTVVHVKIDAITSQYLLLAIGRYEHSLKVNRLLIFLLYDALLQIVLQWNPNRSNDPIISMFVSVLPLE